MSTILLILFRIHNSQSKLLKNILLLKYIAVLMAEEN